MAAVFLYTSGTMLIHFTNFIQTAIMYFKKPLLFVFAFFSIAVCWAQNDSLANKDSMISEDDWLQFFEKNEKLLKPEKVIVITKEKKTVTLQSLLKKEEFAPEALYTLADLDGDGKKELVVWSFTGGAHCCDVLSFYKNIAASKYQYAGRTFAGNSRINDSSEISYNFYEMFGYFFTCYACAYTDTTDVAPIPVQSVLLKYKKGRLMLLPPDNELRSVIHDNLAKLSEQPYKTLPDAYSQDDGWRKEFALNLAVYFYSFGKNLAETQKLFNRYYRFPDTKKVWAEFVKTLNYVRRQNDF
mgnify:CR=1 FL=1